MEDEKAILDTRLFHKGMLFGWVNNGGTLKLNNRFGIELRYNDKNPLSPFVEVSTFVVPLGSQFKSNINPSLARAQATKEKQQQKEKEKEQLFNLEEGDVIEG